MSMQTYYVHQSYPERFMISDGSETDKEASERCEGLRRQFLAAAPETKRRKRSEVQAVLQASLGLLPVTLYDANGAEPDDADATLPIDASGAELTPLWPALPFRYVVVTHKGAFEAAKHDGQGNLLSVGPQCPTTRPVPLAFIPPDSASAPRLQVRIRGSKSRVRLSQTA